MSTEDRATDRPEDRSGRCLEWFQRGLVAEADRLAGADLDFTPDHAPGVDARSPGSTPPR